MIRFVGLDRVSAAWKAEIDAVCRRKPGSRLALNSFQAIARLIELFERNRPPDVSTLSDDDLKRELRATVAEVLHDTPA